MLAAMSRLPHHELAARARAALAYADVEYKEVYEALHVHRTTFARKIGKKGVDKKSTLTDAEISYIIKRTGVGPEWFVADFSRLAEIPMQPRSLTDIAAEAALLRDDKSQPPLESDEDHPDSTRAA